MQQRVLTIVLLIGLFFAVIALASGMSQWRLPDRDTGYAPRQQVAIDHPFYESFAKHHPDHPDIAANQPLSIEYSHRLHAGELGIDCRFCHTSADKSRHAGIPSTDVCMKCHTDITTSFSVMQAELSKRSSQSSDAASAAEDTKPQLLVSELLKPLYHSYGLDENMQPREGAQKQSMPWVRVHNLPDYVYFDHRAHVAAGVTCQHCHGPVETMQRVQQYSSLSMGWCVNCHREATQNGINGKAVHASTDCAACHF